MKDRTQIKEKYKKPSFNGKSIRIYTKIKRNSGPEEELLLSFVES